MKPRLSARQDYDELLRGVFGTFGAGGGVQVSYVQAAISPKDLDKVSLVNEIEGSDRWPVRDLFQREVDSERVEYGLLPWLQDPTRVKFFNPLTLMLIPFDPTGKTVLPAIPTLTRERRQDPDGDTWQELVAQGLYRFRWRISENSEYTEFAEVAWSTTNVKLVAIDGQHRLSALKRFLRDSKGAGFASFLEWRIPVVVAGLTTTSAKVSDHTALDVIRHIFVYINTQAQVPTRSRQILLDDANPTHICVQELLQFVHENDLQSSERQDSSIPPLALFDWRGATHAGKEVHSPIALKSVTELADWLSYYLLGPDFSPEQLAALGLESSGPLAERFHDETLFPGDHLIIREAFRTNVLPGIVHVLRQFTPYAAYIREVRRIEDAAQSHSDAGRHAVAFLRFGSHRGPETEHAIIQKRVDEIVHDVLDARALPHLLVHDIGMRGIMASFGMLRPHHANWSRSAGGSWEAYSRWFAKHLNSVEKDGWYGESGHALRAYITNTPAGDILNFKLEHAHRALGALTTLLVAAYARRSRDLVSEARFEELWELYASGEQALHATLRAGYRKRYLEELADQHPNWSRKKRNDEAVPLANKASAAHLSRLRRRLDAIMDRQ